MPAPLTLPTRCLSAASSVRLAFSLLSTTAFSLSRSTSSLLRLTLELLDPDRCSASACRKSSSSSTLGRGGYEVDSIRPSRPVGYGAVRGILAVNIKYQGQVTNRNVVDGIKAAL